MALQILRLALPPAPARHDVACFMVEANRRIQEFYDRYKSQPLDRFIPCEFEVVYDALCEIRARRLCRGNRFLEWGSGFGGVACLAAFLGFVSCGIEIEEALVREARTLARHFNLPVRYVCGDLVPDTHVAFLDPTAEYLQLSPRETLPSEPDAAAPGPVYEALDLRPDEVDLFFAYPWPGEIDMFVRLFAETADIGALLLTYEGLDELMLRRRI